MLAGISYAQTPMLVLELSATTLTEGENLAASCTAQTITASRVLYIEGESVSHRISADRLSILTFGISTTWIIHPVLRKDAGEYYCFAGGDQGTHLDSPAQILTVNLPPPMLVLELSTTTVTAGERLTASCTAQNITASRVLYAEGESVVQRIGADRLSIILSGNTTTWIIDPVQREDAGRYRCFAGGDQGTHLDSLPQNVTVHFPPNVSVAMPAANTVSGEPAVVVLSVDALPEVTGVQFTLPSARAEDPSLSASGVTSGDVTLTFSSVDRQYNGMYTANFTNNVGFGTVDFELTVYFGPFFSYEGVEQVDGASINLTFAGGQNVTIVCNVSATNPAVSSLLLTTPDAFNVEFEEGTGTIKITNTTAGNEGNYTCTANNGKTTPKSMTFVLTMDEFSPSGSTTDSARNLLATVSVTVVMLLATRFLSSTLS